MRYKGRIFILCVLSVFCISSSFAQKTIVDTLFNRADYEDTFAFGADISWLSQQESWGTYYNNRSGKKTDLMKILQEEEGINAVRFRVWVNPSGGWSGKQDVVNLCKRAHARGLKIMISFHYSDTWADSSNQTIPGQWTDHSADALAQNVYDHTYDVLNALKQEGIVPKWVGIGNETKYGMLYDVGKTKSTAGYQNFVKFINKAYSAIKEVDSTMQAIIHLPNAHDLSTAKSMFNNLKKYGANYDIIGLSAYPRWSHLDVTTDANITSTINTYMNTFKSLRQTFNKPVIVVETGHYCTEPLDGNRFLAEFMKALIKDGELGCFYWEPEAFENSGYALGAWSSTNHQATIAMDAFKGWKHTAVDHYVDVELITPYDTLIAPSAKNLEMKVHATSPNKSTTISKVNFYVDSHLAGTQTEEDDNMYIWCDSSLTAGAHTLYALAYDNLGNSETTDTVNFLAGPARVFQDDGLGFAGASDATMSTENPGYTGAGYLAGTAVKKCTVNWSAVFPEAGTYTMVVRYTAPSIAFGRVGVDSVSTTTLFSFSATKDMSRWKVIEKNIKIETAGMHLVGLQAVTASGLPNIDYMAIISPEGVELVEYGETAGVSTITNNDNSRSFLTNYNLQGMPVNDSFKGIVITEGKKILRK